MSNDWQKKVAVHMETCIEEDASVDQVRIYDKQTASHEQTGTYMTDCLLP